jgi:hypothetical protein
MATVENTAPRPASATHDHLVEPVFSSDNGRRERVLKLVGRLGAVLVGIWLLALLVGAMGLGSLPLIPGSGLLDRAPKGANDTPAPPATGVRQPTSFDAGTQAIVGPGTAQPGSTPTARSRAPAHSMPPAAAAGQLGQPPASPGEPRGRAVRRHGDQTLVAPPPPANENAKGLEVVNPGRLKYDLLLPPQNP